MNDYAMTVPTMKHTQSSFLYRSTRMGVCLVLCLWATTSSAHPLDEMGAKANAYNPLAPKALDTLVDMRDGDKVLMGFFVDLSALLESDGFPDEFKSVVKTGKDDPNWTPFLIKCRAHIRGLVRIYRGEERVDYNIHFPKAEKDGRLDEKKRDFVELRAEVDRKDSQIGLALNPSIEAVRVGVLRLQGNKVFMLSKEKGYTVNLRGESLAAVVKQAPVQMLKGLGDEGSMLDVAWRYIKSGFVHILPLGLDHILFVLGLFFLSIAWRPLLIQVSIFTVAHTVTLAMSTVGLVSVPGEIVEPLIALSITYVALENLFTQSLSRWRMSVVFLFGLLHGMGFAGALAENGLDSQYFITSLITFNIGVEIGQIAVVVGAFLLVGWFRNHEKYRAWCSIPCSIGIGLMGLYWGIDRIFLS